MFNAEIGRFIGLNVESGKLEETQGISALARVYIHQIALYVPGGPINIEAGFMENLPVPGLLGMNGFFENFIVLFDLSELAFDIERIHRV